MKIEDVLSGQSKRKPTRGNRGARTNGISLAPNNKPAATPLEESGSMDGVGAIHISEIKPTLMRLEKELGVDLQNNTLGSVGKKQFSGDIDVAMHIPDDQIPAFIERLARSSIVEEARRGPLVVISRVQIQNYNPDLETDKKRTGFVQVDFMIDEDPAWLKTFYHAPSDKESKYKGAHRNIVIGALSQYVDRVESDGKVADGRPEWTERYMYSSKKGLVRIRRTPTPKKNGDGHTKQNDNEIIDGPWKTGDEIAKKLKLGNTATLNSFESIFAAIEKNLGPKIAVRVAKDVAADKAVQDLGVPDEIKKYL
jgi:hypothetical protein